MSTLELNRTPLSEQVYDLLRTAILKGDFAPGQRLSPQELADRLQLSVTPIRDALRRLETGGLIQVSPRRGTYVSQFSAQDVKEVFESRRIIEQAAAEKLAQGDEACVQRLSEVLDAMTALIDGEEVQDYPRYLELDEEFHNCIVEVLENERLNDFYQSLRAHTYVARALLPNPERRTSQTHAEHREIVEAFRQGDATRAKRAIATHLNNSKSDIFDRTGLTTDAS